MVELMILVPDEKELELKNVLETELPEFEAIIPERPYDEDTIIEKKASGIFHRARNFRNVKEVRCINDVKRTLNFRQRTVF
jgi:hypothetical protein